MRILLVIIVRVKLEGGKMPAAPRPKGRATNIALKILGGDLVTDSNVKKRSRHSYKRLSFKRDNEYRDRYDEQEDKSF